MAFLDKNAIFRPYFELEAIARQSVEASREVICAYFGNIGRNSGYFLHPIFLAVHPNVNSHLIHPSECVRLAILHALGPYQKKCVHHFFFGET